MFVSLFAFVSSAFAQSKPTNSAASDIQMSQLRVGFSQINIATRDILPMGGYGTYVLKTPRLSSEGIHDPLYASAVVIESAQGQLAALVSLDAVGLSGTQIERIEKAVRESVDSKIEIIISATHTHHSPDTLGLWGSIPRTGRDSRYSAQLETATVQAVREAFAKREKAKVSSRVGRHANDSSAARNSFDVNDDFLWLGFYGLEDGQLLGTFTQWSAHPTVLGMENNALSSDYIGAYRETLSQKLARVPHVYVNGALGKVYPLIPKADDPTLIADLFPNGSHDPDVKDGYRIVSTVGARLADAVLSSPEVSMPDFASSGINVCHVPVKFPVDNFLFKLAGELKAVETRIKHGEIATRVTAISVGPLVFTSIPGEAFPKVIRKIDPSVYAGRRPVWMGLGQEWLGYFVDPDDYKNSELKYWTGLSVFKNAEGILLEGESKALQSKDCRSFDDEIEF
ncbi:hypothetical protein EBU99_07840 [bacterium]|nr:hypothetical protein [bacterium]